LANSRLRSFIESILAGGAPRKAESAPETKVGLSVSYFESPTEIPARADTAIRSGVLDGDTCKHCREHDGDEWDVNDPERPELPDAKCRSKEKCRCMWIFSLKPEQ
jgi:hypothetical protein